VIKELFMNNKLKIAAVIAAVTSGYSFAANETLEGSFTTIQALDIQQTTQLVITGLNISATDACELTASADGTGNGYLGDQAMRLGNTTNANAAGSAITTTVDGQNCLASTTGGTIGVFEITGAAGAAVTISVVDGTGGDVEIEPAGCAGSYDGGEDADSCVVLDSATPAVVTLANSSDTGSLGEGAPVAGTTLIALGGVATAAATLDPSTTYDVDFEISVTY
jgi:hypothetical protein